MEKNKQTSREQLCPSKCMLSSLSCLQRELRYQTFRSPKLGKMNPALNTEMTVALKMQKILYKKMEKT